MNSKRPFYHEAPLKLFEYARGLRQSQTSTEKYFWKIINNRKVLNLKFRRQHPIGKYIVDFYCHEVKLVIELDGYIHENPEVKIYDRERQEAIEQLGLKILRFSNEEIYDNLNGVVNKIVEYVKSSGL